MRSAVLVSAVLLCLSACGKVEPEFVAAAGRDFEGTVILSLGARVCFSEADLIAAQSQALGETTRGPERPCYTAGADMPGTFLRPGEQERHALVSLDGTSGEAWVVRDALRSADTSSVGEQ